jgi:folate-binding protein YgfZ
MPFYLFSSSERSFIKVSGKDSFSFLNSIITNDVEKVSSQKGIYAFLLTPQGKFFQDMFITSQAENTYLLEVNNTYREVLMKKLTLYKLRSEVTIEKEDNLKVMAIWGEEIDRYYNLLKEGECIVDEDELVILDPRWSRLGVRIYCKEMRRRGHSEGNYEEMRVIKGVPEGNKDLIMDKSFPLHFGMNKLNAIDYDKGCYVGQEVIARTTYRGVVRKKIFLVNSNIEIEPGLTFLYKENLEAIICSVYNNQGIALLTVNENTPKEFQINVGDYILNMASPLWDLEA